jgi:SulP family sulfate permease
MWIKIFPFINWFKDYNRSHLKSDIISGVTVALVLVPQSMAYAQLAGLPIYYGLYASFLPPIIAALFGSSSQLSTGPVAIVSLMTATALAPLATQGSVEYIEYALLLALLVGLFQLSLGILRFGLIVNFLSHPVVNGFTNAAAIIIATSQLSKIFGVYVDSSERQYETVYNVIKAALKYAHWPTLALAVLAFTIMYVIKRYKPRVPYVLVAVVVTTVISAATGYERNYKVGLSQIDCVKTKMLVGKFNSTNDEIEARARERVKLTAALRDTLEHYDRLIPIDASYESRREVVKLIYQNKISILNAEITGLTEQESAYRAELRNIRYCLYKDTDGETHLANKQNWNGQGDDGRTYMIKVGDDRINDASLMFMGGGAVIGKIPEGLPKLRIPHINLKVLFNLLPMAAIISLLGFMEAISIAKAMAAKTGKLIDPSQELIGQGLANLVSSASHGYAVSGSFSRSAVNIQSGAVSGISSVVSSIFVMITLLFLTPLLYQLPQAVLAAIIMMAVIGLVNITGFIHAWKTQKYDGIIGVLTFVVTLAFAPDLEKGILVGVGLSLILFLIRNMKPNIAMLSKHPDGTFRNRARFNLKQCRHIAVIRYNGSLFFANVDYLEKQILEVVATMPELKHILIVGNGINELDASGEETLSRVVDRLRDAGYDISMSGLNDHVLDAMRRTYLYDKIGEDHLFRNATLAIDALYETTHAGSDENPCPLMQAEFARMEVAAATEFSPEFIKAVEEFNRQKKKREGRQ